MKEADERQDTEVDERPDRQEHPRVVTRDAIESARGTRPQSRPGSEPRAESEARSASEESLAPQRESADGERSGLFERDRASELQRRWTDVQARFVDDPREAVKSADGLVDEVIRDLSTLFSDERTRLEAHWSKDREVSTEDLRVALRRYRSFFERLLSL